MRLPVFRAPGLGFISPPLLVTAVVGARGARSTAELVAVLAALEQDGSLLVVPPRLLGGARRPTEVWFA